MFASRPFLLPVVAGITAVWSLSYGEKKVIFKDDFNRADAERVGNDWITNGAASLKGKALHFQLDDGEFRPRARRTFPIRDGGTFKVSFRFDWLRKDEGTWGFYMQLGNGAEMPKSLVLRSIAVIISSARPSWNGRCSWTVGTMWSTVAKVRSGYITSRPRSRNIWKACGLVTSCTSCKSM